MGGVMDDHWRLPSPVRPWFRGEGLFAVEQVHGTQAHRIGPFLRKHQEAAGAGGGQRSLGDVSWVVAGGVIKTIGLSRLYPQLAEAKLRSRDGDDYVVEQRSARSVRQTSRSGSAPKSSILHMTFAHENPQLAAETLNRFVTEYLDISPARCSRRPRRRRALRTARTHRGAAGDCQHGAAGISSRRMISAIIDAEAAASTKLFMSISSDERPPRSTHPARGGSKVAGLRPPDARHAGEVELYDESDAPQQELVKLKPRSATSC